MELAQFGPHDHCLIPWFDPLFHWHMDWIILGPPVLDRRGVPTQDETVFYDCEVTSTVALSFEDDFGASACNPFLSLDDTFLFSPLESDEKYLESHISGILVEVASGDTPRKGAALLGRADTPEGISANDIESEIIDSGWCLPPRKMHPAFLDSRRDAKDRSTLLLAFVTVNHMTRHFRSRSAELMSGSPTDGMRATIGRYRSKMCDTLPHSAIATSHAVLGILRSMSERGIKRFWKVYET